MVNFISILMKMSIHCYNTTTWVSLRTEEARRKRLQTLFDLYKVQNRQK